MSKRAKPENVKPVRGWARLTEGRLDADLIAAKKNDVVGFHSSFDLTPVRVEIRVVEPKRRRTKEPPSESRCPVAGEARKLKDVIEFLERQRCPETNSPNECGWAHCFKCYTLRLARGEKETERVSLDRIARGEDEDDED